jgi:sulfur transfer protein SufE
MYQHKYDILCWSNNYKFQELRQYINYDKQLPKVQWTIFEVANQLSVTFAQVWVVSKQSDNLFFQYH